MTKTKTILALALLTSFLTGCLVHTQPGHSSRSSGSRACPPAHHWEAGRCVHNGKAKGHYK